MRSRIPFFLAVLMGLPAYSPGSDVWEAQNDDGNSTRNMLRPGLPQRGHDLEGTGTGIIPDTDWMTVVTKDAHSYEARVTAGRHWNCGSCPTFDRVDASGSVLTAGVVSNDETSNGTFARGLTVRWLGQPGVAFLRAASSVGYPPPGLPYDVEFYDTTLFVPRFNNSATQTTVLILQNTTNVPVNGFIYFHNAAGAAIFSVALSVLEHGVTVLNTGSVPALAGQSGSATIAQLGGYGALTGKAVAVEPATGFTFDTAITPAAR